MHPWQYSENQGLILVGCRSPILSGLALTHWKTRKRFTWWVWLLGLLSTIRLSWTFHFRWPFSGSYWDNTVTLVTWRVLIQRLLEASTPSLTMIQVSTEVVRCVNEPGIGLSLHHEIRSLACILAMFLLYMFLLYMYPTNNSNDNQPLTKTTSDFVPQGPL